MTEIACSGHERIASAALASRSAGTSPSMAEEWPSASSSVNRAGAIMAQSVCPWHRSGSTCTFTGGFLPSWSERVRLTVAASRFPSGVVVVPLEVPAGVHPQLHTGHVAGLVRREVKNRVADVDRLAQQNRPSLL